LARHGSDQAVAAYHEALKEWTRDRVPLDWAMTQNNLGIALWSLGQRETGTARLDQAVAAYHEALKERTRDRVPLDWAGTQLNFSSVEITFFDKTGDPAHLVTARTHLMAAREVFLQAGATHYLGMTDENLALVAAREG
jgi:tetratricopeptide (TPR) repeat protein